MPEPCAECGSSECRCSDCLRGEVHPLYGCRPEDLAAERARVENRAAFRPAKGRSWTRGASRHILPARTDQADDPSDDLTEDL